MILPAKNNNTSYEHLLKWFFVGLLSTFCVALWFYVWYSASGCESRGNIFYPYLKCPIFKPPIALGAAISSGILIKLTISSYEATIMNPNSKKLL